MGQDDELGAVADVELAMARLMWDLLVCGLRNSCAAMSVLTQTCHNQGHHFPFPIGEQGQGDRCRAGRVGSAGDVGDEPQGDAG